MATKQEKPKEPARAKVFVSEKLKESDIPQELKEQAALSGGARRSEKVTFLNKSTTPGAFVVEDENKNKWKVYP